MSSDARNDPLEEPTHYRRKRKRRHVRSDHKHDYELVCIDSGMVARFGGHKERIYQSAERCRICGRINRYWLSEWRGAPPEGLRMFKTDGVPDTWFVPDDTEVKE
jgi:hypothetical protein